MPQRLLLALSALLAMAALTPVALAHDAPKTATIEGTLRTWHGDTLNQPVSVGAGIDTTIAGIVPLEQAPGATWGLAGKRVRVNGVKHGAALAVSGGVQAVGAAAPVAAVTGTKTVAVLLFNFDGDTRQPWTTTDVRNVIFDGAGSINAYYQDASYGKMSFAGDVFGWFTLDSTSAGCDWSGWATQARAKALAANVPLGNYTHTVYAFPYVSSCGWAGLGYLPGTTSWINGYMSLRVVGHELGHNLGVHHASTLSCTNAGGTPVPIGSSCSASEYGDPFTIMGSASTRHHNNWHRAQLGWLTDTQTVSSSGIYSLAPAELAGSSPKLLRVARGDGTYLNLEFRQPVATFDDFPSTDPVVTGVSVRLAPDFATIVQSQLIDGNPATPTFADAPFGAGLSFTDPVSGVTMTTITVSPGGASVSIQFPGGPDTQAPTQPGGLTAATTSSSSIKLAWTASSDNVGVSGYEIRRGGVPIATVTGTTYIDSGLLALTTYAYEVRAVDAAGTQSTPAQASATTTFEDLTPPTSPVLLSARVSSRRVTLSWSASADDVKVTGYRVRRNGVQAKQLTGLTFRDNPGRGTFTYTVVAYDAKNNVSGASNAITVVVT